MKSELILKELQKISKINKGILYPEAVVENAKDKNSPLHNFFVWDNTKAAELYRLEQARKLIRVSVQYIEENPDAPYKVFVSLKSDRVKGGGYRELITVMQNEGLKFQLLQDALDDMTTFTEKYKHLKELDKVIREMDIIINQHKEKLIRVQAK
jgi:hypothetical protein